MSDWDLMAVIPSGEALCGDQGVFDAVKEKVNRYIRDRDLVRTGDGWFPRNIVKH